MNKVNLDKDKVKRYNVLQTLAITGFLLGEDNFQEEVIGVGDYIEYDSDVDYYSMTVFLREAENHTSTSGIGFYIVNGGKEVKIYSSRTVITVGITEEIQKLFDEAKAKHKLRSITDKF
jgi:hypothetical protein